MGLTAIIVINILLKAFAIELDLSVKNVIRKKPSPMIFLDTEGSEYYNLIYSQNSTIFTLKLCIGYPQKCFDPMIDTGSDKLWVPGNEYISQRNRHYDPTQSSTAVTTGEHYVIDYLKGTTKGYFVNDVVSLGRGIPENHKFKFVVASNDTDPISDADGILGMLKIDEEYSFVSYLMQVKIIDRFIFSMKLNEDGKSGKIYLGEYDTDFKKDHASCDSKMYYFWSCGMNSVIVGEYIYQMPALQEVTFDSGTTILYGPKDILGIILANAMSDFKDGNKCFLVESGEGDNVAEVYVCVGDIDTSLFPQIELVFGKYGIKVPLAKLFSCNESACSLLFMMSDRNEWLIGQSLLTSYHVLYDGDKQTVGFQGDYSYYENTPDKIVKPLRYGYQKRLITFMIWAAIIITVIFVIYFVNKCSKKRRSEYTSWGETRLI
jgi:hypothetical protein